MSFLRCCDCLDGQGLPALPEGSIDLTLTSPPFDAVFSYYGTLNWNEEIWTKVIAELWRVTAPGGVVCWQVRDQIRHGNTSGTSMRQVAEFRRVGFRERPPIYVETNFAPTIAGYYFNTVTPVYVFSKGRPKTISLLCDSQNTSGNRLRPKTYRDRDGAFKRRTVVDFKQETHKIRGNGGKGGWYYSVGGNKTCSETYLARHPAKMHEGLARDLIATYSAVGDVVLDPFSGVGTTAKMSLLSYRRYLGFEIDPESHASAVRRLRDARVSLRRQFLSA